MSPDPIIVKLQNGDPKAFSELVDKFQSMVFNVCLGYVYNSEDAEDLAQEVFIEVFRSVSGFRGDAKLSTWIYRIAVTKSLELIRSRGRKKRTGKIMSLIGLKEVGYEPSASRYDHPGVKLENRELSEALFKALENLPENQRIAWTMHNMDDQSYKEIAEIMDVSLSSVESLIFRAKKNLQKRLESHYKNLNT